jgi:hypothetical protein
VCKRERGIPAHMCAAVRVLCGMRAVVCGPRCGCDGAWHCMAQVQAEPPQRGMPVQRDLQRRDAWMPAVPERAPRAGQLGRWGHLSQHHHTGCERRVCDVAVLPVLPGLVAAGGWAVGNGPWAARSAARAHSVSATMCCRCVRRLQGVYAGGLWGRRGRAVLRGWSRCSEALSCALCGGAWTVWGDDVWGVCMRALVPSGVLEGG